MICCHLSQHRCLSFSFTDVYECRVFSPTLSGAHRHHRTENTKTHYFLTELDYIIYFKGHMFITQEAKGFNVIKDIFKTDVIFSVERKTSKS